MEELWYQNIAYEDAKELVKENLVSTVAAFIASGYWLKYIRDNRGYEKDGYQTLWECAEKEFGLKISEASRAMSMNDKYSVDGNTPLMSESYKQYNKSQLQEMLTMTDEQMEQVTPDMTVKDIREIKNPEKEALEDDIERLKGFMHTYVYAKYMKLFHLFPTAAGIGVEDLKAVFDGTRDEPMYYCLLLENKGADLIDPSTGEIIGRYSADSVVEVFSEEFAQVCERKAHKVAPEIKGLMDDPYCAACGAALNSPRTENTSYRCGNCGQAVEWAEYIKNFCDVATDSVNTEFEDESEPNIYVEIEADSEEETLNVEFDTEELMQELDDSSDDEQKIVDAEYREVGEDESENVDIPEPEKTYGDDLSAIKQLLKRKNDELTEFLSCDGIPENTIFEKKTIVAALANMVCELEETEEDSIEIEQPELPKLTNNEQRRAWLEDVEAWGLWYEDRNIQARYYKYDFVDGSRCIAVKYRYTCPPWMEESRYKEAGGSYRNTYYHMIYSEEYKKSHKYEYENYYVHSTASINVLIEFIKELAKKADRGQQA